MARLAWDSRACCHIDSTRNRDLSGKIAHGGGGGGGGGLGVVHVLSTQLTLDTDVDFASQFQVLGVRTEYLADKCVHARHPFKKEEKSVISTNLKIGLIIHSASVIFLFFWCIFPRWLIGFGVYKVYSWALDGVFSMPSYANNHQPLTRCCFYVGPASATLDQRKNNTGPTTRLRWDKPTRSCLP